MARNTAVRKCCYERSRPGTGQGLPALDEAPEDRFAAGAPVWTKRLRTGKNDRRIGFAVGSRRGFMRLIACAISALVIGLVAGGTSASATSIDLSTWSCAKFQAADKDDIGVILAWMDGYYRGEDDPPVIDTEKFVANAKKLGEYCAAHPETGIITAADELFAK
jgi:acid stress chaperone HdeB